MGLGNKVNKFNFGDNDHLPDEEGDGLGSVACSICLDTVVKDGDRAWANLQCGHQFHLDCIGSAFNAKGVMQCPNCRKVEKGQWLYANGCRSHPEFNVEDWVHEDEIYDLGSYSEMLLKVQLRDRFRIAVDDHRGRAAVLYTDGYFSSSFHRLAARFRNFRRESLPSAPAFYRRRVPKDLTAEEESALFRMLQAVAVPLIGNACHVFMNGLNRVQVYGLEKLHDALLNRPKNKPLVTVSNHVASLDDPFVIASLLPPKLLLDARNLRWTLCATDRCFKNPVTSAFFRSVKVLPVSRGEGIYQQGMDIAISKLNSGGWVHIFPEGSRSRDGGKTMGAAKRGIGRLILDADTLPMVVPFVHTGMQDIMPIGASVPRIGKTVTVIIGDPIHLSDLSDTEGAKNVSRKQLYDAVSSRIGQRLHQLKQQVDKVSLGAQFSEESPAQISQTDVVSNGLDCQVPKRGLPSEGSISLKVKRFLDSTEIMGFAAKGLFLNMDYKSRGESAKFGEIRALKAWRDVNLVNHGDYRNSITLASLY